MVLYALIFLAMAVSANSDNFEIGYNIILIIWSILLDVFIVAGNFIYAFGISNTTINKVWKYVFPIMVLDFFVFLILDTVIPKDTKNDSVVLFMVATIAATIIYFPAFWANYKLGYSKVKSLD